MRHLRHILLLLPPAVPWLAGCGPAYLGEPIEPVSRAEPLAGVLERQRQSMEGVMAGLTLKVRGRLEGRGFSHRLTGEGVFAGDRARARFRKAGVVKALDVLVKGPEVTVYLPWNEKAYRGNVPDFLITKGEVPEGFYIDPLSVYFPEVEASPILVEKGIKYYVVMCDAGRGFAWRYFHHTFSGLLAKKELLRDGRVLLYYVYERYKDMDGRAVPTLIRFGAPVSGFKGWMRSGSIRLNPAMKETAFRMRLPEETEVTEIRPEEKEEGR